MSSSPKSVYPMNFLSKTQKHRAPFTSKVAEATKASGVRGSSFYTSMNTVLSPCCLPGGSTRKSSPELDSIRGFREQTAMADLAPSRGMEV